MSRNSSEKQKQVIPTWIGCIILLIPVSVAISLNFTRSACGCTGVGTVKYKFRTIIKFQTLHHSEHGTFAEQDLLDLPEKDYLEAKSFHISQEVDRNKVILYATPIIQENSEADTINVEQKSIVAAVEFQQDRYISIICESETPNFSKPQISQSTANQLNCPEGFSLSD